MCDISSQEGDREKGMMVLSSLSPSHLRLWPRAALPSFDISLIYAKPCPEGGSRSGQVDTQKKGTQPFLDAGFFSHRVLVGHGNFFFCAAPPPNPLPPAWHLSYAE